MNFTELRTIISQESQSASFEDASKHLQTALFSLKRHELVPIITEIGSIPEDIGHDSSEEKLYAKVSDIVLAKCFQELGLKSTVIKERANCADVTAKSQYHNYSLVGDAKAFRLSRTAKNQKDFKVTSMSHWKGDNDYAVLVCPYYQYPKSRSQIYGQALNDNITLFSWEYLSILLENNIREDENVNISHLWNTSFTLAQNAVVAERNSCFLNKQDDIIRSYLKLDERQFTAYFAKFRNSIILRGENEIQFWNDRIAEINNYTREKAISELLSSLKLNEKIMSIKKYIDTLRETQ
jgi:type II restriction enzyme